MTNPARVDVLRVDVEPIDVPALGDVGACVRSASPDDALQRVREHDPAVILVGVGSRPDDALAVARAIRAEPRGAATPILFVVPADRPGCGADLVAAVGLSDCIAAPVAPVLLKARVDVYLRWRRDRDAVGRTGGDRGNAGAPADATAGGGPAPAADPTATPRPDADRRTALGGGGAGLYGMAADGTCTFMNAAGAAMLGYTPEELIGRASHHLLHHHRADGSVYPADECRIGLAARAGISERVDGEVFWHRDGRAVPVSYAVYPIRLEDGSAGAVVMFGDVSAGRRADAERDRLVREVHAANAVLVDVLRQAPAFISVMRGPEHRFEMANDRYIQLVGGRDIVGRPIREALPEIGDQGFAEILDRVYRTGETYHGSEVRVLLQRAPNHPLEECFVDFVYLALRDADGSISGVLVHGVDLTERKRAVDELRASEERFQRLIRSMDQGFCVIQMLRDADGRAVDYLFLDVNPAFEQQTGLSEAVGRTMREMVPDMDPFWFETYGRVAATGEPMRFENESKPMRRWFDVYATRVGGEGTDVVTILFTDITARKAAEDDMRRLAADLSEVDRRKTEFLATLAHELRNPLAPLRNGLQVMRQGAADPDIVARARDMMERQVGQMVHLVDDLLDVARITHGKVELKKVLVDLRSVVASAVEVSLPLIESGRHDLDLDVPDQPLWLDADPTRLAQVLSNLLNNAAKYTPPGGRIAIAVRVDGDEVVVTVTDSGVGIPGDSLSTVFEMFAQVGGDSAHAQGGLGIGLTLVRRLVELHGGSVAATSPGRDLGSTFVVRLPLARGVPRQQADEAVAAGMPPPSEPRPLRVLVVDDNVDGAESLAGLLEIAGHATRLAFDGHEAVEIAPGFEPDVVFLDIGLPGRNGYEVARALRAMPALRAAVLVALTGWGTDEDRVRSRDAGFDVHLTKPAEFDVIEALLSKVARGRAV